MVGRCPLRGTHGLIHGFEQWPAPTSELWPGKLFEAASTRGVEGAQSGAQTFACAVLDEYGPALQARQLSTSNALQACVPRRLSTRCKLHEAAEQEERAGRTDRLDSSNHVRPNHSPVAPSQPRSRPFTVAIRFRRILGQNMTLYWTIESVACHVGRVVRQSSVIPQLV